MSSKFIRSVEICYKNILIGSFVSNQLKIFNVITFFFGLRRFRNTTKFPIKPLFIEYFLKR